MIYMRPVRTQTGIRICPLGPATETKSHRFEFIVRPVSCQRIKRNMMEADTNSCRSEIVPVSCKYPLRLLFHGRRSVFCIGGRGGGGGKGANKQAPETLTCKGFLKRSEMLLFLSVSFYIFFYF